MFNVGDKIIYGQTGVCEVMEIVEMSIPGENKKTPYYSLKPLFMSSSTIFTPVENKKIAMRAVISKEEAEKLIKSIPEIKAEPFAPQARKEAALFYENALKSLDCYDLVELTKSIYAKKQIAEQNKKVIGAMDEKFMKKAEELLFGELSVALGIDKDDVFEYIKNMIG
ncbi:MAG: CarD family transcriptional regulator [Clostridia bacterium]|nr:CarD family transcriptional regulator [Clostridia bacterium]